MGRFARGENEKAQDDVLQKAREILRSGKILAVKGVGGFHLLADAANPAAVERLRIRKQRSDKPFAIMVSSLSQARQEVELTAEDERLLTSIAHPIVLSPRRTGGIVCRQAAPGLDSLGVMLAYTPLHVLLLAGFGPVVATSGNLSDEPLCYQNQDALSRLRLIADAFLLHNREIHVPVEDSVVHSGWKLRPVHTPVRRSRGYAPLPVVLHRPRQDSPQSRADTAPLSGCAEHSDSGLDLGSDLECAKNRRQRRSHARRLCSPSAVN
ncbi:Sua5/YciO/YrdC/YwlC family protein [Arcanobacterium hippocoleae]